MFAPRNNATRSSRSRAIILCITESLEATDDDALFAKLHFFLSCLRIFKAEMALLVTILKQACMHAKCVLNISV